MKKILAVLVAVLMLCGIGVGAVDSTTLSYTVEDAYTWTAPESIVFTTNVNNEAKTGSVSVSQNIIPNGKKLQIKVSPSQTAFTITSVEGATRDYVVKKAGTALAAGDMVLEVAAGTNTGSQELSFELQSVAVQKSGTYTGTMAFVAAIVDAS
jgi:hypothetical protein